MKDTKEQIELLTDDELARLLLRALWNWHDVGGISMKRSKESCLLDAVFVSLRLPEKDGLNIDALREVELLEAAKERVKSPIFNQQKMLFPDRIEFLSGRSLSILLLQELQALQKRQRKVTTEERFPSIQECLLLDNALSLLLIFEELPVGTFSAKELIEESGNRFSKRVERESERFPY